MVLPINDCVQSKLFDRGELLPCLGEMKQPFDLSFACSLAMLFIMSVLGEEMLCRSISSFNGNFENIESILATLLHDIVGA